jgi:methylated-DNA-[protein]-cysteine S-methyltransferase
VRAARIRRTPGGVEEEFGRGDALTSVEVHSAHLPGTRAGPITIWTSPDGVRRIEFGALPKERHTDPPEAWPPKLRAAVEQLEEYFAKDRTTFDLDLDFSGVTSDFQQEVYDQLMKVGYGHVTSYGQLARDIGKPDQARAVGQAVGANPIPIVIPCHRVIASDGSLTGFSGGLMAKVELLKLEGVDVSGTSPSSKVHPEVIPLDL